MSLHETSHDRCKRTDRLQDVETVHQCSRIDCARANRLTVLMDTQSQNLRSIWILLLQLPGDLTCSRAGSSWRLQRRPRPHWPWSRFPVSGFKQGKSTDVNLTLHNLTHPLLGPVSVL